jgi:hypothetical protein
VPPEWALPKAAAKGRVCRLTGGCPHPARCQGRAFLHARRRLPNSPSASALQEPELKGKSHLAGPVPLPTVFKKTVVKIGAKKELVLIVYF